MKNDLFLAIAFLNAIKYEYKKIVILFEAGKGVIYYPINLRDSEVKKFNETRYCF